MAGCVVGVCVSVVAGCKVLVKDKILKIPDTTTLSELFQDVKPHGADIDIEDVSVKCLTKPGNTIIVWRVPSSQTESEKMTDAVQMTMQLKPRLPEYHTRQQRLDFNKSYGNIVKLTPAIRRSLYSCLTGDSCASSNPEMDARLHLALFGRVP